MAQEKQKISFQKVWHIQVSGLNMLDFASDHHSFATYGKDSILRLFNHRGQELWRRNPGFELVALSLSDTLEVMAIDTEKYSMLFGPEGATLWRKRPFPALTGKISASGDSFAFVTTDPAIIGADRSLRVKWAYRNLMKRPPGIAISALAQTTIFPCADDRGEGLTAVNYAGKPYDAFMGLDTIIAVDLSDDGQIALALATNGRLFCLNVVKGFGIWKCAYETSLSGISYATKSAESIVFSESGHLIKLDPTGKKIWEHHFTDRLLKASITSDGTSIFYATERGEIGLLTQSSSQLSNKMTFREIPAKPISANIQGSFRKVWQKELACSAKHNSVMHLWKGEDGVEYCLTWDGVENLFCINDIGEEIWQIRIAGSEVLDISVSVDADLAVVITCRGVAGFDLSGYESFKFLGQFFKAHVFDNAAMLLIDNDGKCRFYQSSDHYSHTLELPEKATEFIRTGNNAIIRTPHSLNRIDETGKILDKLVSDEILSFVSLSQNAEFIICGDETGKISIHDENLREFFSYNLGKKITLGAYHKEEETVFAATDSDDIFVLKRRSGEMTRNSLTGKPVLIAPHESGIIIGTDLDQLGLINTDGQIQARYTSPYKLKSLAPCQRKMCVIVLADDSLSCIAAMNNNVSAKP